MLARLSAAAVTLVTFDTRAAGAADDRVLHHRRLRREPVAAAGRRAAGAASSSCSPRCSRSSRTSSASLIAHAAGHASAVRRARRIGDADRRAGHRPRLRAGVRGRRACPAPPRSRSPRRWSASSPAGSSAGRSARCSIERYQLRQPQRRGAPRAADRGARSSRSSCGAGAARRRARTRKRTRCSSAGRDPGRDVGRARAGSAAWLDRPVGVDAARLHRRDAGRRVDPQHRRRRPACSACRSGRSTTSAASRCRCSWCWR